MDLGLKDKVVVVTGSGAGIGGAISRVLIEEGATPVIFARRMPKPAFLADLERRQPRATVILANPARDEDCRKAVSEARADRARQDLCLCHGKGGRSLASRRNGQQRSPCMAYGSMP